MIIKKLSPQEWSELSPHAQWICFGQKHDASSDRIDFALLAVSDLNVPMGYITVRENNSEDIFWQYGGAFPSIRNTIHSYHTYHAAKLWCAERYKTVFTYIQNTNITMIKFALKLGFKIVGVRQFFDTLLVELFLNLKEA